MQRDTAAIVKFEVEVPDRLVTNSSTVTIVAHQVGRPRGNAIGSVAFSIIGLAIGTARRGRATPEHPAEYRLIAPGCDIVSRYGEAELAGVIFQASVELSVVAGGYEWTMEKPRVHDSVADPGVDEGREITE